MRKMRKRPKSVKGHRRRFLGVFVLAALSCIVLFIDSSMRPAIKSVAAYQAEQMCTRVINDAVTEVLAESELTYDELIHIERDLEGKISVVQADIVAMNNLKAGISSKVAGIISQRSMSAVFIPMGTFTNMDFLTGRGPRVEFKIQFANALTSTIKNNFISAGINQTRHQIMLEIKAKVFALVPGYRTSTEVTTNFLLAETIIVGDVPDAFTNVEERAGSELSGIINDYGYGAPAAP